MPQNHTPTTSRFLNAESRVKNGEFVRAESSFRNWVTADGSPGPSGSGDYKAQSGRYHLYVSYACPWAHRTLIFRQLKGLTEHISVSVVHPLMLQGGWRFASNANDYPDATPDHINGVEFLSQNYLKANANFRGSITVPVLWDKQQQTIVNNESSEIIRMFNSAFNHLLEPDYAAVDYYPIPLQQAIDAINQPIYEKVNNGVYRCGFAKSSIAYERAFDDLFTMLNELEKRLSKQRYLVGEQLTEADWRLFTTLVRFDAVYYNHFKTNLKRLIDYPNLWAYTRELYQTPGIAATVNMQHIKYHYFASHKSINPTGIVPKGPALDFMQAHNRQQLS